MNSSIPQCDRCSSPVTDSIEVEIEKHGKVKMGKNIRGSWICNDCMIERVSEVTSTNQDDGLHHEHIRDASRSDVSPNTPPADEADL
jgi:hypothetical protein